MRLKGGKARRRAMISLGLNPDEALSEFIFSEIIKGQLLRCPGCGAAYWTIDGFYNHLAWHDRLMLENDFKIGGSCESETRPWSMMRQLVLLRDVGKCRVKGCGSRFRPEVHHIIPRELGGSNNFKNLVTLCYFHHRSTLKEDIREELAAF